MRGRFGRGALADTVAVLGVLVVLGALGGVLWWLVVDPAVVTKTRDGATLSVLELQRQFSADGWYAVIAAVAGFLSGLGLTAWRTRDFRLTVVLLLLGAAAAAWVMAAVGGALGPAAPDAVLANAAPRAKAPVPLEVTGTPFYLLWPVSVLAGSLMVLWSSPGVDLPREPVPGPMRDRDQGVGQNPASTDR